MSSEEGERLLFPSFVFPDSFPADDATPVVSGGEQKKAGRQRRRRRARQAASGEGGGDDAAKKRRLSDEQAQFLEMNFRKERKLETPRKVQLAAELGLDTKQVAVWFQNRRARYKSKLIEEEFSKLRAAHDAVVVHNCRLEAELLRLKERLAETEEEKNKAMAASAAATGGGGGSSPSSSSFSTVTAMVGGQQFGMEEVETDLTYMSEYAYTNYMMDLAAGGYLGGVYDQFS
ncbi:homeobox-leucine zipper protein HOX12-like [Triticum dicoccoides]|uniref:Homeobox-leucine zipper protein n=2 Tax=Triticum TaxID=4564 RepID=A0A9R0VVR8_TRITD|nr:homeobox-leucine zipper protein HOX12-like [Triticum dicoccoides]XP_044360170.1 homeobox-leucine zipper protein HOX12-like [Triticum aestivum]VAH87754.1 unnamed protein product [Triticum turgidum subsp. durum]